MDRKLQIELNNHPYSKDMIYASVSLRGGYITHNFIVDDWEAMCFRMHSFLFVHIAEI